MKYFYLKLLGKVTGLIGTIKDVIEFVKVQEQVRSQLLLL
nr:MAG TPA: hypothetical protein [Caudoviricetes sp.]